MILGFQRDKLKMSCITFVLNHESNNMANQSQLIPVASPTVEGGTPYYSFTLKSN